MEKSASRISTAKFARLSARQQHKILHQWAQSTTDLELFRKHYERLLAVAGIDTYHPPAWIDRARVLEDYAEFHRLQAGLGASISLPQSPLAWRPSFAVEVLADQIRSPFNMGNMVRLIDNFGLQRLLYGAMWFSADHPQFKKAARGADQWVPIRHEPDPVQYLTSCRREVVALEQGAAALRLDEWQPQGPVTIVVGHEQHGVSQAIRRCCDRLVAIPTYGNKASMNVSSALAVCAYQAVKVMVPTEPTLEVEQ